MIEVEEFQGESVSVLIMETGSFTESTSSKYDSLKNEWNNTNRTDLPIKGIGSQQKALDRMEAIVFAN